VARSGAADILKETDPALVKLQMDLYWVARASQAPHDWFRRAPGRFVMWHVKDVHPVSRDYTGDVSAAKFSHEAEVC
jgi:sugar phosphate isomerase/epimerase